jgi:hypothetical protein
MARSKELTIKVNTWDDADLVGYEVHTVIGGYSDYGHLELRIKARRNGYNGREYWEDVVTLTAQNNRLNRYDQDSDEYKDNKTTHEIAWLRNDSENWGKWYALQIDRWGSSHIDDQLFLATQFAPIWKKVQAVVEDKNLTFKYKDGISHIIAALNILGARPLRRTSEYGREFEYDPRLATTY